MSLSKKDWFRKVRRAFFLRGIWGKTARHLMEELEDHYQSTICSHKKEGTDESVSEKTVLEALGDPKRIAQIASKELHPYWRLVKSSLLFAAVLLIALASAALCLRWSGERDCKRAEAELRSKGEKLTFADLVPPMPPEEENFFADPLWAEYAEIVQKKTEREIDGWQPRLASDQYQLQRWQSVPLTPEEKGRLCGLMTGGREPQNRKDAFSLLRAKLLEQKDPQNQQETAALFLDVMAPAIPVLTRIANLSERPRAQFPIRYDLGFGTTFPQLSAIVTLAKIMNGKALSELILEKNREAARDTLTLLRLTSILKNEPVLISFLVRASSVSQALQPINEGIRRHAWTEADLVRFQELLSDLHLQEDFLMALKGERASFNQTDPSLCAAQLADSSAGSNFFQRMKAKLVQMYYRSIFPKDKAYHHLWLQRTVESLNFNIAKGWNAASVPSFDAEINDLRTNPLKKWIYPLHVMNISAISGCNQIAAEAQTQVVQTMIACALERYRISRESYPTSLDALVPEYFAKLPSSPITGKPMNYSLNPDCTLLLWSPGWTLKSFGGKPGEFKGDGDIVWNQPLTKIASEKSKAPQ